MADAGLTDVRELDDFLATHSLPLYRFAVALTGHHEDAADLLQSTLVQIVLHWPKVNRADHQTAYVRRMMVHESGRLWRRLRRTREISVPELADRPENRDDPANVELRLILLTALKTLAPRQRAAVVLRYHEGLSEQETAEVLNCSVGNVKSQSARGMQKLRTYLASEGVGPFVFEHRSEGQL